MSKTIPLNFEWIPTFDAARVYLHIGGVHNHHNSRLNTMERDTDGHWRDTVDVPEDLRASYRIVPVDAATASATEDTGSPSFDLRTRWMQLSQNVVEGDNSLEYRYPPREPTESGRIVMPSAPAAPGWETGDALTQWSTEELDGRQVYLAGPADATELLVLFDAHHWIRTPLDAALRRLHAAGKLPNFRIAAIDTAANRVAELSRSPLMRSFIADTLLPHFPQYTPAHRVLSGQSLGGLTSLDIAIAQPRLCRGIVSNSGSYWFPHGSAQAGGSIAEDLHNGAAAALAAAGTRVFMTVGKNEGMGMEIHTPAVARELEAAGVDFRLEVTSTAHEMAAWEGGLTRGLCWLYS